jgi:hypothetical protein
MESLEDVNKSSDIESRLLKGKDSDSSDYIKQISSFNILS